jgi:flagellar basal-body rod protein FlgB
LKIGLDNALGPHAQALQLRGVRTEVLARNIAHADTPGYQARDVDFKAELAKRLDASDNSGLRLRGTHAPLRTTHSGHLPLNENSAGGSALELKYRSPLLGSFDRNTVDTQMEQAAFAENNVQFQAALRFLNGRFQGLMTAVRGE